MDTVNEYTIEHIMPQNDSLSEKWKEELGQEWERVHQTWLHRLGNLTLTGYNSEYGDKPFIEKRDMTGGFRESPLKLNASLGQIDEWNENAIEARSARLAAVALSVWPAPKIPTAVLATYRSGEAEKVTYSIEDHPHLLTDNMQELFEDFRQEVLALDPCVSEEFLKLYVAYKAETNFVDVVPQANQLLLSLNMGFAEIRDPMELCRNVSNLGHWGNGAVEVPISNLDQLPYVIGLVRQSLEKQLGSEESG